MNTCAIATIVSFAVYGIGYIVQRQHLSIAAQFLNGDNDSIAIGFSSIDDIPYTLYFNIFDMNSERKQVWSGYHCIRKYLGN